MSEQIIRFTAHGSAPMMMMKMLIMMMFFWFRSIFSQQPENSQHSDQEKYVLADRYLGVTTDEPTHCGEDS